jgi:hypothetical protein
VLPSSAIWFLLCCVEADLVVRGVTAVATRATRLDLDPEVFFWKESL